MTDNLLDDFGEDSNELPGMLNVLTILTFIWSSIMVIISIYNLFTIEKQLADFDKSMRSLEGINTPMNSMLESIMEGARLALENGPLLNTISLFVSILCIIGALWMRKMEKKGYFLYVGACLIEIFVPIILIGNGILAGMVLIGSVFSILFIILYGVNFKHLK